MAALVTEPDAGNSTAARATLDLDALVGEIVQLLKQEVTEDAVGEYCKSSEPSHDKGPGEANWGWKEVIYRSLKRLVDNHGGVPVFTGSEKNGKEFMLDFVWLERDESGGFRRAVLGCECEWWKGSEGLKELLRNFRKLLFFKAPLKLLVYSSSDGYSEEKHREDKRRALGDCLKEFKEHTKGDRYLLIELIKSKRRNGHWEQDQPRVFYVKEDGPPQEVEFSLFNGD